MKRALALVFALASIALAACGDDDGSTTTVTETITVISGATGDVGPITTTTGDTDFPAEPCPDADSPPNITEVTSYGTDCEAVEDAMAQIGPVSEEFKLGDFDCARTEGSELAGTWECKGEASYFTFKFAD